MDTEDIIEGKGLKIKSSKATAKLNKKIGKTITKAAKKTANVAKKTANAVKKAAKGIKKTFSACKGKDRYISKLKKQIHSAKLKLQDMFSANNRLITKNNSLLDNMQYFRGLIFGNKNVKGYSEAIIDEKIKYDNVVQQELSQSVKENFSSSDSNYNAVKTENEILTNQLNNNTDKSSANDQLFINLSARTETLATINSALGWVIFVVICIAAYYIWFGDKSLKDRLVLVKVVWIYLLIVGTLEYVLFYLAIYLRALFGGRAYQSHDYWKFPTFTLIDKLIVVLLILSLFVE